MRWHKVTWPLPISPHFGLLASRSLLSDVPHRRCNQYQRRPNNGPSLRAFKFDRQHGSKISSYKTVGRPAIH
jgi:hypothetical protein